MLNKILIFVAVLILLPASTQAQKKKKTVNPQTLITLIDIPTAEGPYSADISSIREHQCPEWFKDAKFGMFVDWGLYSVGGWAPKSEKGAMYPDWYMYNMLDGKTKEYHEKTWGKNFMPDDFIPLFTADDYNPDQLVAIAKDAGIKYLIPFCKHHDGFCLWGSSYTARDAVDLGPRRDLIRPLADACNREGLKFGFYFSVEEWFYPVLKDGKKYIREWGGKLQDWDESKTKIHLTGKYPVKDFFGDYIEPQAKEFINKYDPDILWFDGDWTDFPETYHTPDIIAHFYNRAEGRKKVALNDRNGRVRFQIGDFFCSEYHELPEDYEFKHYWEENRGISQSFGYNRDDTDENVLSAKDFIHLFIRTVSNNGNLLLIVNLDGKGALPAIQEYRLREIGKWLKINGEAIYGSRPWLASSQDLKPEQMRANIGTSGGAATEQKDINPQKSDDAGKDAIRFTQSKDGKTVYAICTQFPKDELVINSIYASPTTGKVVMLGAEDTPLEWKQEPASIYSRLKIKIPDSLYELRQNEYAWVFKITL
jgi:alpha-L-fucosidase